VLGINDPHAWKLVGLLFSLRVFAAVSAIPQCRLIPDSFVHLLPSVGPLGVVTFCILYSLAIMGMGLFGGEITLDSTDLEAVAGSAAGIYYTMNMNGLPSAMYTLIMTIAGNNINTFTETYFGVGSEGGRIWFIIVYLEITLVLCNVLVSFFIDAYSQASKECKLKISGANGSTTASRKATVSPELFSLSDLAGQSTRSD